VTQYAVPQHSIHYLKLLRFQLFYVEKIIHRPWFLISESFRDLTPVYSRCSKAPTFIAHKYFIPPYLKKGNVSLTTQIPLCQQIQTQSSHINSSHYIWPNKVTFLCLQQTFRIASSHHERAFVFQCDLKLSLESNRQIMSHIRKPVKAFAVEGLFKQLLFCLRGVAVITSSYFISCWAEWYN